MSRLTLLALAAASFLLGCSQPLPPPTPADGGVEPHRDVLATLNVRLSLDAGVTVSGDLRLALVWYPLPVDSDGGTTPPGDVSHQELSYAGQFPQVLTVELYEPPPATALSHPEGDPSGAFALGSLVAYEDLNHDGRLTLDKRGAATDLVLGSTAGVGAFDTFPNRTWVAWLRHGSELESTTKPGSRGVPGYNVVHFRERATPLELLPLATALTIEFTNEFTNDPRLQLIVCPKAYVTGVENACGVRVWDAPETLGSIELDDDGRISSSVWVHGTNSKVTINGVAPGHNLYELVPSVLRIGVNDVVVEADGYEPFRFQVTVPSSFEVTSPTAGSTIAQGSSLTATWTSAVGATVYEAGFSVGYSNIFWAQKRVSGTTASLTVPQAKEPARGRLRVEAQDGKLSSSYSRVSVVGKSVRTVFFDVAP